MFLPNTISPAAQRKIQLYSAAYYLFELGKSHPQVISILSEYEQDVSLVTSITNKAMTDEWDKYYKKGQELFAEGKTFDEVLVKIHEQEDDLEIAKWICNEWYKLKALYAETVIDAPANITEGIEGIIFFGLGTIVVSYIGVNWLTKAAFIIGFIAALIIWIYGLLQRRLSKKLKRYFNL